jgi:hypothetical protein
MAVPVILLGSEASMLKRTDAVKIKFTAMTFLRSVKLGTRRNRIRNGDAKKNRYIFYNR